MILAKYYVEIIVVTLILMGIVIYIATGRAMKKLGEISKELKEKEDEYDKNNSL